MRSEWPHVFLTMPTPIFFNFYESVVARKNQAFLSICSRDIVDLKILLSDWPISQEPDFYQIWDLCTNTANDANFRDRPNSKKKFD